MTNVIGIDLGTSNSCMSIVRRGVPEIIPGPDGTRLTPSVVHFGPDGTVRVGRAALALRILDPANTVTGIKRFVGRRYNEVVDLARNAAFNVLPGKNNLATVEARGRAYTPQEVCAYLLRALKNAAEAHMQDHVSQAVITVPAYFGEQQRQATREAACIAGWEPLRIVNEPTAAALAYGISHRDDEKIAVFDLGGGTFDITILDIGQRVFEVVAIAGDGFLGGDDFDQCIVDWVADDILLGHGLHLADFEVALEQVRRASTEAKCELSSRAATVIDLPFLSLGGSKTLPVHLELNRERFESICGELFERLLPPCQRVFQDCEWFDRKIEKVLLVGAPTRMSCIDRVVERAFGKTPVRAVNPDEAVAIGAAIQGSILQGGTRDMLLLDVVPHTIGLEDDKGGCIPLIKRNVTIPTRRSKVFTTSADNQHSVEINILEGENPLASGNRSLGRLVYDGIPPAPRGKPQIVVTLDFDANGSIAVQATDSETWRRRQLLIKTNTGLDNDALQGAMRRVTAMNWS